MTFDIEIKTTKQNYAKNIKMQFGKSNTLERTDSTENNEMCTDKGGCSQSSVHVNLSHKTE